MATSTSGVTDKTTNTEGMVVGTVVQVAGPAVDCQFPEGQIPLVYTAIRITSEGFTVPKPIDIICEAQQHIGEGRVRTIALQPTEGLVLGLEARVAGRGEMRGDVGVAIGALLRADELGAGDLGGRDHRAFGGDARNQNEPPRREAREEEPGAKGLADGYMHGVKGLR